MVLVTFSTYSLHSVNCITCKTHSLSQECKNDLEKCDFYVVVGERGYLSFSCANLKAALPHPIFFEIGGWNLVK